MGAEVKIEGLDDLLDKLKEIPIVLRKRVLRNALAAGARVVQKDAKRNAPVLNLGGSIKAPYRKPGTVRDAIRVRTSKDDRKAGDVGVFVNVLPAKGAKFKTTTSSFLGVKVKTRTQTKASQRGAKSPNDPFYWRFLEFGTKKMAARPFLKTAGGKLPESLKIIEAALSKWFNKTNASGKVQP
jgi:HK97 gp10 family phage protein